jgi:hypothetical protein
MNAKHWRAHYLRAVSESDRAELETHLRAAEAAIIGHVVPSDAESEEAVMKQALSALRLLKSE